MGSAVRKRLTATCVSNPPTSPQTRCSSQPASPITCTAASVLLSCFHPFSPSSTGSQHREDDIFPLLQVLCWLPTAHRKMPHSTLRPPRPYDLTRPLSILPWQPPASAHCASQPHTSSSRPHGALAGPSLVLKPCPQFIAVQRAPSRPSGLCSDDTSFRRPP